MLDVVEEADRKACWREHRVESCIECLSADIAIDNEHSAKDIQ